MPTLLLTARHTEDTQRLWRACVQNGWKVARVHRWQVPEVSTSDVAVYGEPLFAQHVTQTLGLKLLEPSVDWLARLGQRWAGRKVRLCSLRKAREVTECSFIKPAEDKCFDARVYSSGKDLPSTDVLPASLPVLVQDIVDWESEFRCFVPGRRVVAASIYSRNGDLARNAEGEWIAGETETTEAIDFCELALRDPDVSLPEAAVVDVGIIRNRGWAVVECNSAWGSGLYGCDPSAVLGVIRRSCVPLGKVEKGL